LKQIAVVILNWNGCHHLARFLPSVMAHSALADIIVADNASTDNSINYVKHHYPQIEIIRLEQNYGFAEGYNRALKNLPHPFFVLLNSDVELTAEWLNPMLVMMETDDRIAAIQPKILSYTHRSYFEYAGAAGGYLDRYGYAFCRGRLFDTIEKDEGQYDDEREIFWASGCALFIRSHIYREAGGLDADLFAHFEEIDLCWRIKRMGYKVMYNPHSVVYHLGGGTLSAQSSYKTFLNFRNNLAVLYKNTPSPRIWGILAVRLLADALAGIGYLSKGQIKNCFAIIKAHWRFFLHIRSWHSKRAKNTPRIQSLTGQYHLSIVKTYFYDKKKYFSLLNQRDHLD